MPARYIIEGGRIPLGWAISHRDFDKDVKLAYPIPLHFLVRWTRDLWFWCMTVGRPGYCERHDLQVYRTGRQDGERMVERYITAHDIEAKRQFQLGWLAAVEHLTKTVEMLDHNR